MIMKDLVFPIQRTFAVQKQIQYIFRLFSVAPSVLCSPPILIVPIYTLIYISLFLHTSSLAVVVTVHSIFYDDTVFFSYF